MNNADIKDTIHFARWYCAQYAAEVELGASRLRVAQIVLARKRRLPLFHAEQLRGRTKSIIAFDRAMDGRE